MAAEVGLRARGKKQSRIGSDILRDRHLYLMLLPFMAYYIIFYYRPFGGLVIAFQNFKPLLGIEGSAWVGFQNFLDFFNGPYFWRIVGNTLTISLLNLVFAFPVPIFLALLFNEIRNSKLRTLFQTISYMPYFVSTVVLAGLIVNFLSPSTGIVNLILKQLGSEPIYFLTRPEYFRTIYLIQGIWAGAGFGSVIYYSALCSIDMDLYQAVKIDGGGRLRQIWHIALPGIRPTIAVMLIMQIGNILNVGYEMIILLYQPATYQTADVISTYMYRVGIQNSNYSLSTAVGLLNGVVSLILVMAANAVSGKISETGVL